MPVRKRRSVESADCGGGIGWLILGQYREEAISRGLDTGREGRLYAPEENPEDRRRPKRLGNKVSTESSGFGLCPVDVDQFLMVSDPMLIAAGIDERRKWDECARNQDDDKEADASQRFTEFLLCECSDHVGAPWCGRVESYGPQ